MPSTSTAVPKEALPFSLVPPARILNCLLVTRLLSTVAPPGRRLEMSPTFMSCTCSRAVLSTVREVVAAASFSLAVTTAPERVRLSISSWNLTFSRFFSNLSSRVRVAYPRQEMVTTLFRALILVMVNRPSRSVTDHCSVASSTTVANSTGSPVAFSTTRPLRLCVCAHRA